ncbi:MAG: hypothetical protein K6A34_06380 [Methanobrevibacter sp.]|nr:hypothetical protein [Methanobrevibacter sp.]
MKNLFPKWNQDRIVYSWEDDNLRIGADDVDVLEIKGHSQFWSDFISCCDGKNSVTDIQELFKEKYKILPDVIEHYFEKLSNRNLVEMLDQSINQIQEYPLVESLETYYSSEGLGGFKLMKKWRILRLLF